MSDKFAFLYQSSISDEEFNFLEKAFKKAGISLTNPATCKIHALTDQGDVFFVSRKWISSKIQMKHPFSIQFWITDAIDIYFRLRFGEGFVVKEYSLDGLKEELDSIISILLEDFTHQACSKTFSYLVIDKIGVTQDFSWDDFFMKDEEKRFPRIPPDILGLPKKKIEQSLIFLQNMVSYKITDSYMILQKYPRSTWTQDIDLSI